MSKDTLLNKMRSCDLHAVVLGLGYVGLPLAAVLADAGYTVTGVDVDDEKVAKINQGYSYIPDVSSEKITDLIEKDKFKATTDFSVVREADAVSICVPTPLRKTRDPDLSYILTVTDEIKPYIHPEMVVVLESTTYPGTTRELLLPKLSQDGQLKVGKDFFLGFSPERVDPGREDWTTVDTPKVVGGITSACTEVVQVYYQQAMDTVVPVTSAEVAEMSKLLENTFRMVNIGLVNEMALMCDRMDIDIWEVIEAAATKPFGFMKFTPGPGLGGHCIPIDPLFLSWKLRSLNYTARFIDLASEINTNMPRHVVEKIQDALNKEGKPVKDSRVLVLGVAYKPDIDDLRESPALDIIGLLQNKGANVVYHDPFIPEVSDKGFELQSVEKLIPELEAADCVAIITNHSTYDYAQILDHAQCIMDARNALGELGRDHPNVHVL